jgi:hypothetical protein
MIPLRPTLIAACALLVLGGCQTARMEVTNSLTERGFVATRDLELGQVLQWLPDEQALLPIAIIDQPARQYDNVADMRVRFETGISFSGGVRLSPEQQADLETEVAARTSTVLENATTRALENITSLVINDWRARPEIWRRFAAGERGRVVAALGGIRDRSSLALTAARMKQDTIFRDAAHHFLRLFDRMISRFAETATDAEISELSDTRTARAFMLLGRVAGTFD